MALNLVRFVGILLCGTLGFISALSAFPLFAELFFSLISVGCLCFC